MFSSYFSNYIPVHKSSSEHSLASRKGQDTEDVASVRENINLDDEAAMTIGMRRGTSFASEKDFDQMSVSSRSTAYHSRTTSQDETLSLVAHGIADVGKTMQCIQSKKSELLGIP